MEKAIRGLYEEACRVIGMPCGLFSLQEAIREEIFPGQSNLPVYGYIETGNEYQNS